MFETIFLLAAQFGSKGWIYTCQGEATRKIFSLISKVYSM